MKRETLAYTRFVLKHGINDLAKRAAADALATDAEVKRLRRENKALRARLGVVTVKFDKRRGYTFDILKPRKAPGKAKRK